MSLFYRFAYWIGLKPWEEMATLPIAAQISSFFDREESERRLAVSRVEDSQDARPAVYELALV